jgi:hypothetical protein
VVDNSLKILFAGAIFILAYAATTYAVNEYKWYKFKKEYACEVGIAYGHKIQASSNGSDFSVPFRTSYICTNGPKHVIVLDD